MTYQHPMCPPSRRKILATLAAIPVAILASPARASVPSLALLGALERLQAAATRHDEALEAYHTACEQIDQWEQENPQPASKRGTRRWLKRARKYADAVSGQQWECVVVAGSDFHHAQEAVAAVECAGPADLQLMIEASVEHDSRILSIINRAPIARAVVRAIAGGAS